jgi:DNA polymerase-3 subunit gamma/tau
MSGRSVDVIEIDAASHTGVDNVRENIIENARFTPTTSKYKVFIIDEVHMLSTGAFNALLKTLEEPPAHVIFILCTTETHKLPETIISRCQRFDLKRVPREQLLGRLEHLVKLESKTVESSVLETIVRQSEGCVRDAESLLGKILALGEAVTMEMAELVLPKNDRSQAIALVGYIIEHNTTAGIELVNKLLDDGVNLSLFTQTLLELLRQMILIKTNAGLKSFGIELEAGEEQQLEQLTEKVNHSDILQMIEKFMLVEQRLKSATIAQLPLEIAVIELTIESTPTVPRDTPPRPPQGTAPAPVASAPITPVKATPKIDQAVAQAVAEIRKVKEASAIETAPVANESTHLAPAVFDLKQVVAIWPMVVEQLLQYNYTLSSLLRISEPRRCDGSALEIAVKSRFYKDRLEDIPNRQLVERLLSESLGGSVAIKTMIDETLSAGITDSPTAPSYAPIEPATAPPPSANVVQDVMNLF